ncbi:MAG: PH domain-containing protein [Phycisphaerales bacterium]|nr:PH domain-containing protein [Phycisphaerales bacterium]
MIRINRIIEPPGYTESGVPQPGPPQTCPVCRYSLQGLPCPHSCPECGFAYDVNTYACAPRSFLRFTGSCLVILLFQVGYMPASGPPSPILVIGFPLVYSILFAYATVAYKRGPFVAAAPAGLMYRTGLRVHIVDWPRVREFHLTGSQGRSLHVETTEGRTLPLHNIAAAREDFECLISAARSYRLGHVLGSSCGETCEEAREP